MGKGVGVVVRQGEGVVVGQGEGVVVGQGVGKGNHVDIVIIMYQLNRCTNHDLVLCEVVLLSNWLFHIFFSSLPTL